MNGENFLKVTPIRPKKNEINIVFSIMNHNFMGHAALFCCVVINNLYTDADHFILMFRGNVSNSKAMIDAIGQVKKDIDDSISKNFFIKL